MNENHSNSELIFKSRWIGPQARSAIKAFPVVVISGARQVGKSTFLQNEFSDFRYLSLDDFSTLQQAKNDPASLWGMLWDISPISKSGSLYAMPPQKRKPAQLVGWFLPFKRQPDRSSIKE